MKQLIMDVEPPRRQELTNVDFFKTLTADSAYVLGVIATDGCVYDGDQVIITQSHDCGREFLEQLRKMTGGSIFSGCGKSEAHKASNRLCLYGKEIVEIMRSYGITERKTFSIDFPELPRIMIPHFLRGVVDGDGCVFLGKQGKAGRGIPEFKISFISASFPFISGAAYEIRECGLPLAQGYAKGRVYGLSWSTLAAIEICDWLYRDSTPQMRMERKYKKFVDYLVIRSGARNKKGPRPAAVECSGHYIGSTG
jgi:hypothetical protein